MFYIKDKQYFFLPSFYNGNQKETVEIFQVQKFLQ